ncbi:MAG TPA: hypothetical protein VGK33_17680 [Chloroflexota bacterium]
MPKPRYHTAVSLGLAAVMVARTRRWQSAIPILIAGVLVDADHVLDLFANRQGADVRWTILPLHAWEWVIALLSRRRGMTDGLAGGLAVHLALDQTNHAITHPLFYWISVRALHRFRARPPLTSIERYHAGSRWMANGPNDWF